MMVIDSLKSVIGYFNKIPFASDILWSRRIKCSMHLQSAWEAWQGHTHFLDLILIDIFRPKTIKKYLRDSP